MIPISKLTLACYHYLKRHDEFRRIWGHNFDLLKKHINFFMKEWKPIGIKDLNLALRGELILPPKCSILTFDDGLKEHSTIIAPYLNELGIKAIFNVCTNTILKREPTIAQTIHFGTAYFGIRIFSQMIIPYIGDDVIRADYLKMLEDKKMVKLNDLNLAIKIFFNKNKAQKKSQEVMNTFWNKELEKISPDIFDKVFMDEADVRNILSLGHTVGIHTASHAHVTDKCFNQEFIQTEIIEAKRDLEKISNGHVDSFAYPFGKKKDSLLEDENFSKLKATGLDNIFTTYFDGDARCRKDNLGRYLSQSQDSVHMLQSNLWYYEIGNNNK